MHPIIIFLFFFFFAFGDYQTRNIFRPVVPELISGVVALFLQLPAE